MENDVSRGRMRQRYPVTSDVVSYEADEASGKLVANIDGESIKLSISYRTQTEGICAWQGKPLPFATAWVGDDLHLWLDGSLFIFRHVERQRDLGHRGIASGDEPSASSGRAIVSDHDNRRIFSVMAGRVLSVGVRPGDHISQGDEVCVLEAMKMEQIIRSTAAGVVKSVHIEIGQQIPTGGLLVELEGESSIS